MGVDGEMKEMVGVDGEMKEMVPDGEMEKKRSLLLVVWML